MQTEHFLKNNIDSYFSNVQILNQAQLVNNIGLVCKRGALFGVTNVNVNPLTLVLLNCFNYIFGAGIAEHE